ncbi:Dfp1/Him1, central region domain containing protein [Amanita muscaria]
MATSLRRPLAHRLPQPLPRSPGSKRSRSPDPEEHPVPSSKRSRTVSAVALVNDNDKSTRQAMRERKLAEKEQQKAEFRDKYRRAFPSWTFYFDLDHVDPDRAAAPSFEARIQELGGAIEDFFSNQITHLITNQSPQEANKENFPRSRTLSTKPGGGLKSPVKSKGRTPNDSLAMLGYDLVSKAESFGMKIWTTSKLDSVLNRCLDVPDNLSTNRASLASQSTNNSQRSLTRLLQSERIHGTSERDPMQRRHDFHYFSKSSYFVLVEDLRQELATVAAHEYEISSKSRDGKTPWPILYCHPCARGPFIPFDDKEEKRWERQQKAENDKQVDRQERRNKVIRVQALRKTAEIHARGSRDLRRSISLGNLQRLTSYGAGPQETCLDADVLESNNASGYLPSGVGATYAAASGNSVSITSTTGATSTAGYPLRNAQLPSALSGRMKQQILTSRRICGLAEKGQSGGKDKLMGPPEKVPQVVLRKSKSTNTLRLPKRNEGSKPGYCESCRVKFEDFRSHIVSRKHQKFAMDDANYLQLDCVLARVQRRTLQQLQGEHQQLRGKCQYTCDSESQATGDSYLQ